MESDIEACLQSIASQTYPLTQMEVLVVDGDSTDDTKRVATQAMNKLGLSGDVLHSPAGTIPANLNVGLAAASGEVLCRVDAKSRIPPHYVERCVHRLSKDPELSVVGGSPVAIAPRNDAVGRGIARALNNRWGMGFSRYRTQRWSGESDTVYLGAFGVEQLRLVGGWNESMHANQDFELNRRMARTGRVWFDRELRVEFIPRATIRDLFERHRRFGRYKVRYWRLSGEAPRLRQWVLLLGPPIAVVAGTVWALRRNSMRRIVALGVLGAGTTLIVEAAGCDEPEGEPVAHVVAAVTLVTAGTAWLLGIVEELIRSSSSG
jgi:glycosyltransferase involved in cell wall biosynthesis